MDSASTGGGAASARSAAVHMNICEHGRQRSTCKDCGGSGLCEHGWLRGRCKECEESEGEHVTILEATEVEESDWEEDSPEEEPQHGRLTMAVQTHAATAAKPRGGKRKR